MRFFKRSSTLDRFAAELVRSADQLATDLVPEGADAVLIIQVATEICYYLLQMAQRQVGAFLTHEQMSVVIPKLTFLVFDQFIAAYGLHTAFTGAKFEEFRAAWINEGADRNDFYGQCRIGEGPSGGMAGDVSWEASKVIGEIAGADPLKRMTLSLSLPMAAMQMNRDNLIRAGRN